MPCDPCWQESFWGRRGDQPDLMVPILLRVMRGSGGLQTLLPKSFAEELSAKKIELMIAIMSKKTCFVVLGFFFFLIKKHGFLGCFLLVCFINYGLSFNMWNLSSPTRDGIQPPALAE